MRNWVLICASVLTVYSQLRAELPPSVYEQRQKAAPEHLVLEVQRVEIEPGESSDQQIVHVVARVQKVNRTASQLQPGALIQIDYAVTQRPRGYVGPGEVPILRELTETVAYLAKKEGGPGYMPVAGVMSFSDF